MLIAIYFTGLDFFESSILEKRKRESIDDTRISYQSRSFAERFKA